MPVFIILTLNTASAILEEETILKWIQPLLEEASVPINLWSSQWCVPDLASILLSSGKENASPIYSSQVLKFFTQLLQLGEFTYV